MDKKLADRMRFCSAAFLVLKKDGKILLSKRINTGHEDGNYSMVAGHIEPGETAEMAVVRETLEEAGLYIKTADLKVVHVLHNNGDLEYFDIFLTPTKYEGEVENKEPDRCGDLSWFKPDALPSNTVGYIRHTIECIEKGIFYSNFGF